MHFEQIKNWKISARASRSYISYLEEKNLNYYFRALLHKMPCFQVAINIISTNKNKLFWKGIKKRASNILYSGHYRHIEEKKKSARALRSHIKVVLGGEEVKIIISGDQFNKRASNVGCFLFRSLF